MEEILVSICCITYNHEKYIRDALDGFLKQKVNFKYEVIIRDDASTDKTAEIIREYQEKYPDIIKPIYESENGYKKGIKALPITYQQVKGKYVAICEGDDYWIDENKLQKQTDYMQQHSDCTFCFHNARIDYVRSNRSEIYIQPNARYKKYLTENGIYNAGNIHLIAFGGIPTASFFFRAENLKKLPAWYYTCHCGDLPLKLIMTNFGYAYYIDEVMSVYRRETEGSLTDKWKNERQQDALKGIQQTKQVIEILEHFNEYSNYKYQKGIEESKKYYEIEILALQNDYQTIATSEYKKYYKLKHHDALGIKLFIKKNLNSIYRKYKKIGIDKK